MNANDISGLVVLYLTGVLVAAIVQTYRDDKCLPANAGRVFWWPIYAVKYLGRTLWKAVREP